ncbi:LysE family translocator [Polaromonas eurypsychrophila]|uniref:Lysine transporter LysE n=1 Tax=Polaromonas eurypsychrophila TaxID=1614635 RepID=A0A916S9Z3_9BURK|nr:LysE family translocator [Polaromonas eurypsychrophila]GGA90893.1 lysine transporter LysE [Polaromonas eurypsychrophila]
MGGVENLGLFIAAGILLNLTPGPDVLYIVTHALRRGARAGMVAALGITAGCFVHIAAAALGVSALMAASSTAFSVLKWAGAAYLVYVGVRLLTSKSTGFAIDSGAIDARSVRAKGLRAIFFQGFWTNVLNPKVALFFLAFVPQFITPGVENKAGVFLLLGLLFNLNGLWVNIGWALTAAWLARRVHAVQRGMFWLDRAAGVLFIGFGLKLALSDNPSDH